MPLRSSAVLPGDPHSMGATQHITSSHVFDKMTVHEICPVFGMMTVVLFGVEQRMNERMTRVKGAS